ncbi:MAG: TlpA family protein disulfide reductase [Oligoflexia bacterium]|nr:TlpA family protein disulfide reductase [Oligoflexia bacterium]
MPADGLGNALREAAERRPATAVAAAQVLSGAKPGDDALRFKLGEVWFLTQAWQQASEDLAASEGARPADVWDPRGDWRGDAGGKLRGRSMLARSLFALGRRDAATELTRALLLTSSQPALQGLLGMAAMRDPKPWLVTLPPLEDLSVQTLDGASWRLSEHRGHPVLLAFFATWCGPCRKELPEIVELWRQRRDQGLDVLAVSIDQADTAGDLPAFVDALGLPFAVAHAPALAERFGIDGIPAVRLVDASGAQIYSARGYSMGDIARTRDAVDHALAAQTDPDTAGRSNLGMAWSVRDAKLLDFQGIKGVRDLVVAEGDIVLSRQGAPPLVLNDGGPDLDTQGKGPSRGDLLAWQQGPVLSAAGNLWVRASSPEGRPRWFLTTADPVQSLCASGGLLWFSTTQELLAVDALGRLVHRVAGGAQDIASDGQDGLYAVDGSVWRHLDPGGLELERLPAVGARHVDGTGRVSSGLFSDLLTGRFGPEGALRTVLVRADDGVVLGLDGGGRAAFTWELGEPVRIAAIDRDADGRDELLVVVPRRGLATVALSLP